MTPAESRSYALDMFQQNPELYSEAHRRAILDGKVELGMAPFAARLAGGAFQYRVVADPAVWPEHSDPLKVMWRQSVQPDASEITMVFRNATQFGGAVPVTFRVDFERGAAWRIAVLNQ
ncbi:hypothetical protein [Pseudoduganella armeniaca]|uniref:Uncharacterized protein n=1 Tax=Pseudoduganella armeniaca TaxID=2072590 RepID=A0A2R4CGU9_9BURK|nr:hypothetical protein [Pseudoduganella armeniaca]AVR98825.1 hypothetical protein C9I28_26800 [Pseudoduganella armeniaca]